MTLNNLCIIALKDLCKKCVEVALFFIINSACVKIVVAISIKVLLQCRVLYFLKTPQEIGAVIGRTLK